MADPEAVLSFWREIGPSAWFKKNEIVDEEIRRRFLPMWEAARAGELDHWRQTAHSALALVIVLDQFPRNMFRASARAFSTDAQAREVARRMVDAGFDMQIEPDLRAFCYMPFMHSEDLDDQDLCCTLMRERVEKRESVFHAEKHREVIARFGRFPHRNAVLGRVSTEEERRFLEEGGYSP